MTHGIPQVLAAQPGAPYWLHLRFDDGAEGDLDLGQFLDFRGVFEAVRDPGFFAQVRIEGGTVIWPNDADIDPVVLHCWLTGRPLPGKLNR